jgi:hypothetical protein
MDWKDIAGVVGKAAPILGTLLGGPAGAAVGGLVASALGVGSTPDEIQHAIATDPEAALKLATLEIENKIKLQQMVYDHADKLIEAGTLGIQADVDDRKSARTAAVQGDTTKHVFWLSVVLITVTITAEIVAMFHGVSDRADPLIVGRVLGLLDSACLLVLNFNYGSSSGSKRATELLAKSTPAAEPNVATAP